MLDLARSKFNDIQERPVKSSSSVSQEGLCLTSELDDNGEEVISPTNGNANDVFAGFSINCQLTPVEMPMVETFTIPDTDVDADRYIQLSRTTIVKNAANDHKIHIEETDGTDYTEGGAIADGVYVCSDTGKISFHVNQKGKSIVVTYKYNPTALELQSTYWESGINMNAAGTFNRIAVGKPPCVVYTSEYNPKRDWGSATSIKTGANGQLEDQNGSGVAIPGARVIHVPDTDNPYLGIEIL